MRKQATPPLECRARVFMTLKETPPEHDACVRSMAYFSHSQVRVQNNTACPSRMECGITLRKDHSLVQGATLNDIQNGWHQERNTWHMPRAASMKEANRLWTHTLHGTTAAQVCWYKLPEWCPFSTLILACCRHTQMQ
jgi:hypothetical protein